MYSALEGGHGVAPVGPLKMNPKPNILTPRTVLDQDEITWISVEGELESSPSSSPSTWGIKPSPVLIDRTGLFVIKLTDFSTRLQLFHHSGISSGDLMVHVEAYSCREKHLWRMVSKSIRGLQHERCRVPTTSHSA